MDLVVRGGTVVAPDRIEQLDVAISDGRIVAVGENLPPGGKTIDARGLLVLPGAIDVHTHFHHYVDYVGTYNADGYESGTRTAMAGGITTVVNYAFQEDGRPLREALEREMALGTAEAHIDFGLHPVITSVSDASVAEIGGLAGGGFPSLKVFTAVTGFALPDRDILRVLAEAARHPLLVNVHAEDDPLIRFLTEENLRLGNTDVRYLPLSRPPVAERIAADRVAAYAAELGCPVYFVHVSSGGAIDALARARADGTELYIETRPVYLFLDEERYSLPDRNGNKYVCLPPLRGRADREALWRALPSTVQTYATDHAPWLADQKLNTASDFSRIPAGVSNLQTSVPMLYSEGVAAGRLSLRRFVELTSTNPAKLFGLYPRKGCIAPGVDADLQILDPNAVFVVRAERMESRADYDPYEGYECHGWPRYVVSRGDVVVVEGEVRSMPGRGRFLERAPFDRQLARSTLAISDDVALAPDPEATDPAVMVP